VLEDDPEEKERLVEMLRKALLDIEERLRVRVPVYILITMCDKLIGFVDFFKHLPGLSNRSLFGWSKASDFDAPLDTAEFRHGFDRIARHLERLGVEFMEQDAAKGSGSAEDLARMDRLMAFPHEFATLGPRLATMLEQIFAPSSFNEHHFCRGVYFTSGVQEGSPVIAAARDLVADRLATFERDDLAELAEESKSYFIADLYQEKIFREQGLIRLTRRAGTEQKRKRWAYRGAAAVVLIAFTSWVVNDLLKRHGVADEPLRALSAVVGWDQTGIETLYEGSELLIRLEEFSGVIGHFNELLEDASSTSAPEIRDSREKVVAAYRKAFCNKVIDPLFTYLLGRLDNEQLYRSWSDADRWAKLLSKLHSLGYRGQLDLAADPKPYDWDVATLAALLGDLAVVDRALGASQVDYEKIRILCRSLQEESEALDRIRTLFEKKHAPKIRGILEKRYLSYWEQFASNAAGSLPTETSTDKSVEAVRAWWALKGLDAGLRARLGELQGVLAPADLRRVSRLQDYEAIQDAWTAKYKTGAGSFLKLKANHQGAVNRVQRSERPTLPPVFKETITDQYDKSKSILWPVEDAAGEQANDLTTKRRSVNDALKKLQSSFSFEPLVDYQAWKADRVEGLLKRMDNFVVYASNPIDNLFDSQQANDFKLLGGPFGAIVTRLVRDVTLAQKQPVDTAPKELEELLKHFKSNPVETALTNRAVTLFFQALNPRIAGNDAVAAVDQLVPRGSETFPALQASALGRLTKALVQGYRGYQAPGTDKKIWSDASGVDASLISLARRYLDRFATYWEGGFVEEVAPAAGVEAFKSMLMNTSIQRFLNQEIRWPERQLPKFDSLLARAVKQQGAGDLWFRPFVMLMKDDPAAGTLMTRVAKITSSWKYYASGGAATVQEALKITLLAPLGEYSAATINDEQDFLKKAETQARNSALYRKIKFRTLPEVHPVVDRINEYCAAAKTALAQRPQSLFTTHWKRLTSRAKDPQDSDRLELLSGRFPFTGNVVGQERVQVADFAEARDFLVGDDNLKVLYALADRMTLADPEQKQFILRCRALRDLLAAPRIDFGLRSHYHDREMGLPREPGPLSDPPAYVPHPGWIFSFRTAGADSAEPLNFQANPKSKQGRFSHKPGTAVRFSFRPDDEAERWVWVEPKLMTKGNDGAGGDFNLLAFLYAQERYAGTVSGRPGHIRWVMVPFTRIENNIDVYGYLVVGMEMSVVRDDQPKKLVLPAELPDLSVLKK